MQLKCGFFIFLVLFAVADPGFPRGGGANSPGGCQHMILPKYPKNCMKSKEFGPPVPPLTSATDLLGEGNLEINLFCEQSRTDHFSCCSLGIYYTKSIRTFNAHNLRPLPVKHTHFIDTNKCLFSLQNCYIFHAYYNWATSLYHYMYVRVGGGHFKQELN